MKTTTKTVRIGRKHYQAFEGQLLTAKVGLNDPHVSFGCGLYSGRRIAEELGAGVYVHADGERLSLFVRGPSGRVRKLWTKRYHRIEWL